MGLGTCVLKQPAQLVLGDARHTAETARRAHSRGHLLVVCVKNTKTEARDAEILEGKKEGRETWFARLPAPFPFPPKDRKLGLTLLVPPITWVLLGSGKLERRQYDQGHEELLKDETGVNEARQEGGLEVLLDMRACRAQSSRNSCRSEAGEAARGPLGNSAGQLPGARSAKSRTLSLAGAFLQLVQSPTPGRQLFTRVGHPPFPKRAAPLSAKLLLLPGLAWPRFGSRDPIFGPPLPRIFVLLPQKCRS